MAIIFSIIQVVAGLFLIAVILLQSGKTPGLSGAIGGGSDTFLARNKARTLDSRLAKMTKWVAGLFVLLTIALILVV